MKINTTHLSHRSLRLVCAVQVYKTIARIASSKWVGRHTDADHIVSMIAEQFLDIRFLRCVEQVANVETGSWGSLAVVAATLIRLTVVGISLIVVALALAPILTAVEAVALLWLLDARRVVFDAPVVRGGRAPIWLLAWRR
jgi:hypothetical protein